MKKLLILACWLIILLTTINYVNADAVSLEDTDGIIAELVTLPADYQFFIFEPQPISSFNDIFLVNGSLSYDVCGRFDDIASSLPWLDDLTYYSYNPPSLSDVSPVIIIPEPATILLLTLGGLILRKSK